MPQLRSGWVAFAAAAAALAPHPAAAEPAARRLYDLLALYPKARTSRASFPTVRRPSPADGVLRDGLFLHPAVIGQPARAEYTLPLPPAANEGRLLLVFETTLSDGVKMADPDLKPDGVQFGVEVEGDAIFRRDCVTSKWQPACVDLTGWAGKTVRVALTVDAKTNLSYDWALFGLPRVVAVEGPPRSMHLTPALAAVRTGAAAGVVAVAYVAGTGVRALLSPIGGSAPPILLNEAPGTTAAGSPWLAAEYSFPGATGARLEITPSQAAASGMVWIGGYAPDPAIERVCPASAVPVAGVAGCVRAVVRNRGLGALPAGAATLTGSAGGARLVALPVPALSPGESWIAQWPWRPGATGVTGLRAELRVAGAPPAVRAASAEVFAAAGPAAATVIDNGKLRLQFVRAGQGVAYAVVSGRRSGAWVRTAVWRPLLRLAPGDGAPVEVRPSAIAVKGAHAGALLTGSLRDATGARWDVRLDVRLDASRPLARVTASVAADRPSSVRQLLCPNLYVGDGESGEAKTWGILPGVELLFGGEPSSNPRDLAPPLNLRNAPSPLKVSSPFMAVSTGREGRAAPAGAEAMWTPDSLRDTGSALPPRPDGPNQMTTALWWEPLQAWDGEERPLGARFSVPNAEEGMANHRLGLMIPTGADYARENADTAYRPVALRARQPLILRATICAMPGPALSAMALWTRSRGGLPTAAKPPRTLEQEWRLNREGLLRTAWDAATGKWRACIDWEPRHAPGLASLLWLNARASADRARTAEADRRVADVRSAILRDEGAAGLLSGANCHIARWEFPFLTGYLAEAMATLDLQVKAAADAVPADGLWRFDGGTGPTAALGRKGDSVLGTSAVHAYSILRYARITGNAAATSAGERSLAAMERFRVPRGAGTWECPMYEPDLLAAAYAVGACTEGYRATGNPRWLTDALYWAESGLPFIYLWAAPGKPASLGATTSNIGSTFYLHSWIGMPVQWVGLVYAYYLRALADAQEQAAPAPTAPATPLQPVTGFGPVEWRRLAQLITVSGQWQEFADGPRAGTYPDSIGELSTPNPPFLNCEDILANTLRQAGHTLDVKTATLRDAGRTIVLSSSADIVDLRADGRLLRAKLRFYIGQVSHGFITGFRPAVVTADGVPLAALARPPRTEPGFWYDAATGRTYLSAPHTARNVEVVLAP
ncbi:MAG: hypothetical protein NT029_06785 [Armatimonadetes bacterium]|nr:hypothetical protein [Armatimonadota bacterium]